MSQAITGVIVLKINGRDVLAEDVQLMVGGQERTARYASGAHQGPSSKPVAARVTATLLHREDLDIVGLSQAIDNTIEIITDTGVTFLVNNAYLTNPAELSSGEGQASVEFMGDPATTT